ncbi:velvet factor-domain-containing protein [Sporodiniella umbellata]|nr:velvet factor-domain-containing protein [Sporodiniella umbellata]
MYKMNHTALFATSLNTKQGGNKYELCIVQHPIRARCCGLGEKDKRPIDPPPILKLTAENQQGDLVELDAKDAALFLVHCQLFDESGTCDRSLIQTPWHSTPTAKLQTGFSLNDKPDHVRNLIGSVISNGYFLNDENSIPGIYFIFQDLSIRLESTYTLQFALINLDKRHSDTGTKIQNEIFSEPFTVYSAKKFPGMTESTSLSRCFSKQGIKIPVRMAIQKPAFSHQKVDVTAFEDQQRDFASGSNQPSPKNHKLSIKHLLISTSDSEDETFKSS